MAVIRLCIVCVCVCVRVFSCNMEQRHRQLQRQQHQQVRDAPSTRMLVNSVSDLTGEVQFFVDHGRVPWGVQAVGDRHGRRAAMAVVLRRMLGDPRMPPAGRARVILTAATATSCDELTYGDVC